MNLLSRFACLVTLSLLASGQGAFTPRPKKPGLNDPTVRIPLSRLVPEASFAIPGSPDWIAIGRDIWVSNKPKNSITRIDPRKNAIVQTISGLNQPCSGLAIGFGSLWAPNCGDGSVARINLESGKITLTIPTGVADSEGGIAIGASSVWIVTDSKGTLARIDPASSAVKNKIPLQAGCVTPTFGFESLWVSCTAANSVIRVDPQSGKVVATIPTGPRPRFLTVGEGSVWTLNQGDGSITRISPTTNRMQASISVGIPGEGGDISAGEGSVWATSFGFPVSRVDPRSNRVVQQFVGEGGDAIRVGGGAVWLSNYKFGSEWKLDPQKVAALRP